MMGGRWQQALIGIIMGVVAFVVIQELLEAFEITAEGGAGESLIATLVPIAVAVAVILFAFRGMGR